MKRKLLIAVLAIILIVVGSILVLILLVDLQPLKLLQSKSNK